MDGTVVASALVNTLFDKLGSLLLNEFSLLWGLKTDLEAFKSTISTVKDVLEDAEECCITDKQVYNWLRKLKDNVYDADNLLDQLHLEAQRQKDDSRGQTSRVINNLLSQLNPVKRLKLAHKIKSITEKLNAIAAERTKFHLKIKAIKYSKNNTNYSQTWSMIDEDAICGRDCEKEEIISWLMQNDGDENIFVITIVGLGGIGKTTLAQLVYNIAELNRHFDLKMWVYVSEAFDFKRIVRQMSESEFENKYDYENLDLVGEKLRRKLSGKKLLLVLDDVWSNNCEENWDKLKSVLKYGASGSKIIVTSRDVEVSEIMDAAFCFKLEGLSEDSSWDLFKQRAFGISEKEVHSQILEIAKQIMKRCGGVPLALKALGSIMRSKHSIDEWCSMRDSDIWLSNDGDYVIRSLKLSYMHLPSSLKECFTYCSIFSKGQWISKLELINQWIAHGFISLPDNKGAVDIKGHEHFNHLVQMSFLYNVFEDINGEVTCQMHDLVHDLARSIINHEISAINVMDRAENMNIDCRYLSLIKYSGKIERRIIEKLRSLHIEGSNFADDADMISKAKSLRSLALNGIYLERFTFSSKKLIHLRYVCISDCWFTEIPIDFCALWSLQSLHLKGCHYLERLPESIGRAVGLRTLELGNCQMLESLPRSICQCKSLQNLIIWVRQLESIPNSIGQLVNIRLLNFYGCEKLKRLPDDAIGMFDSIKSINLVQCSNLEEIPLSIGKLKSLESLDLSYCQSLKSLPNSIGNLQNLHVLDLKSSSIDALPSSISKLVNLENLNVRGCLNLSELPGGFGEIKKLKFLDVKRCPLSGMPIGISKLTNLRELSNFVVGKGDKYAHISELEHLDFLSGSLWISGLQNVSNPREAVVANLKQKKYLEHITLCWNQDTADREWDLAVLEALRPPPTIKILSLNGYPGAKYSKWMMLEETSISSFPDLTSLCLADLKNCTHLPRLVELPHLKHLWLSEMNSLKNFTGYFPGLVELNIEFMPNLEELTTTKLVHYEDQETYESAFPHLTRLGIRYCPNLTMQPHRPPSVVELDIHESIKEETSSQVSLASLTIDGIPIAGAISFPHKN